MRQGDSSWRLQIYEMTDASRQATAAEALALRGGLNVDTRTCDRGSFLIVECPDPAETSAVHELVMMADAGAQLIHSTIAPSVRSESL